MLGYFWIMVLVLLQGCGSSTHFAGQYKKLTGSSKKEEARPRASEANASVGHNQSLSLSCRDEAQGGSLSTEPNETWLDIELEPVCPFDEVLASDFEDKKVANIVFVIDITGSMQDNIDAVSQNIIAFAKELHDRQWQVNFAAILFKDQIWKTLPFSSADVLSDQLQRWPAEGGGINHPQEAGLLAIERASELLAALSKSNRDYLSYKNIILYASDAPAYYRNDRDFAVDRLSAGLRKSLAAVWEHFRIYYSVSDLDSSLPMMPNPKRQMETLASTLGIANKPLEFPLSKEALMKQFLGEFDAWSTEDKIICYLQDVSLAGADASQGSVTISSHTELGGGQAQAIGSLRLSLGPSPASLMIEAKRCCTTEDQIGRACLDEVVSRIAVEH